MSEITIPASAGAAELRALLAQLENQAQSAYTQAAGEFFALLVENNEVKPSTSEKSDWHGFSVTVPMEVNGHKYSFNVIVTDVEQTEAAKEVTKTLREAEKQAERQSAETKKLMEKLASLGVSIDLEAGVPEHKS